MSDMDDFLKDYIFSGIDDDELTSNTQELVEYLYFEDVYSPEPIIKTDWDPVTNDVRRSDGGNIQPRTYLILVSEDKENTFMYPAMELREWIRMGAFGYNYGKDKAVLVDVHNAEDINRALRSHDRIYAIFIYGHSFSKSHGFAIGLKPHKRYNIGYTQLMKDATPVTSLDNSNVLPEGFIHLYSCDAVSDTGEDIAHALASHFGMKVWASKSGVSFFPPLLPRQFKKAPYTNPTQRLDDETIGFEWILP